MAILCLVPLSAAQGGDSSIQEIDAFGPTLIAIECEDGPCSGFSLEISGSDDIIYEDDLSWSGNATGRLAYNIIKESGATGAASVVALTSDNGFIHEDGDVNASSGSKDGLNSIPASDVCLDGLCETHTIPTKKMTGWFDSGGDSDAWLLVSNGIAFVDSVISEAPFLVEIWKERADDTRAVSYTHLRAHET